MMSVKVPTQVPNEPHESARQPQLSKETSPSIKARSKKITFADNSDCTQQTISQKSNSTYKDGLSQPAPGIRHRDRLMWIQRRRGEGLWVQCDSCDNWRHMPHILDRHELPEKWFCKMNPDATMADCSIPESGLRLREEEDLIHSEYSAGSVVWARLAGWPWWPALVDDCPDTEQFYWLDGFSDIPTHYNVVFFDAHEVTRAWIAPEMLKSYNSNRKSLISKDRKYKNRLEVSMRQAEDALSLTTQNRLEKYSFISRFKGNINSPKKITKKDLVRYQKQLKRKFNIEFEIESDSDSDVEENHPQELPNKNNAKGKKVNKKQNIPAKPKEKTKSLEQEPTTDIVGKTDHTTLINDTLESESPVDIRNKNNEPVNIISTNEQFKQPHSLVVQVGSTISSQMEQNPKETLHEDNDTSTTYVTDELSQSLATPIEFGNLQVPSPSSDDFEF